MEEKFTVYYFGNDRPSRVVRIDTKDWIAWWEPAGIVEYIMDKMKASSGFDHNAFVEDCETISNIGSTIMHEWNLYKGVEIEELSNIEAFGKDRINRVLKEFVKMWGFEVFPW